MAKRILNVVTNVGHYDDPSHPTGPVALGAHPCLAGLRGARPRADPRQPGRGSGAARAAGAEVPSYDKTAKAWRGDPARMALLEDTAIPDQIVAADYDAIYFTGGHGVMYDFPASEGLQRITREIFERGGVVSSVCHGYCGLLNTRLSDGCHLVAGRTMTGFAWTDEVLARADKLVPYNGDEELKKRGADYQKATLPFVSYAVVDGNLVTGQNPASAKETATKVAAALA